MTIAQGASAAQSPPHVGDQCVTPSRKRNRGARRPPGVPRASGGARRLRPSTALGFGVTAAVILADTMPRMTPQTRVTKTLNHTHGHGVESRPPPAPIPAEPSASRERRGLVADAATVRDPAVEAGRDPPDEHGCECGECSRDVVPVTRDQDEHEDEGEDADPEGDAPEVGSVSRLECQRHRDEGGHRTEDAGDEDLAERGVVATRGEEQAPGDEGDRKDQVELLRNTESAVGAVLPPSPSGT